MTYIPGKGPRYPKIVFVGDCPSPEDEHTLEPFSSSVGSMLSQLLRNSNINRGDVWLTNVCKSHVIPNEKGKRKVPFEVRCKLSDIDYQKSIQELLVELQSLQPNVICALGSSALAAIIGKKNLKDYRGSILQGMGFKVIGTYHPSDLLYQENDVNASWCKEIALFDFRRVVQESQSRNLELPNRILEICESSAQLYDFKQRYKNYNDPSIDIEARNCIPICLGISYSSSEGLTIPLWNGVTNSDLSSTWILLADILSQSLAVGQNFGYDRDKIKRLGLILKGLKSDVMLKSFAINPELPKNLAFNTSIYTREPFYKNEGMYEGSEKDLFIGCARDSCVTKEIDQAMDSDLDELNLRPYYEKFLLPLHDFYADIESLGFRKDNNVHKALITKYVAWSEDIKYKLFQLSGRTINTRSPKQVEELIYEQWDFPRRKGTGEEVLTQLLANSKSKYKDGLSLILEKRRVDKTLDSYLFSPSDFDGRMRTSYFICLETGRSATQQQEPPIRPNVEFKDEDGKKKKAARGMAFQTITKHGDIGADVRTMFIPDEGEIFIQADSSQAEARVIFLLAEDYQALKDIDEHDYHALTASWFFGGEEKDYSKKVLGYESPIRFAGKTLRHAGHLGASKRRAAIEINTQARKFKINYTISEQEADRALKIFHRKQPKIKEIFQASIVRQLEKDRRLIAPVPYGIDAPLGGVRQFFEKNRDELARQAYSYIPQRTVSENTKGAGLRIKRRIPAIKILVESHDALLFSIPIERTQEWGKVIKEEFERPIDFSKCSLPRGQLIIPCDLEEGMNYKDLSKFRFVELTK